MSTGGEKGSSDLPEQSGEGLNLGSAEEIIITFCSNHCVFIQHAVMAGAELPLCVNLSLKQSNVKMW